MHGRENQSLVLLESLECIYLALCLDAAITSVHWMDAENVGTRTP